MSSSDSDDDMYMNIIERLNKIRRNYKYEDLGQESLAENNKYSCDNSLDINPAPVSIYATQKTRKSNTRTSSKFENRIAHCSRRLTEKKVNLAETNNLDSALIVISDDAESITNPASSGLKRRATKRKAQKPNNSKPSKRFLRKETECELIDNDFITIDSSSDTNSPDEDSTVRESNKARCRDKGKRNTSRARTKTRPPTIDPNINNRSINDNQTDSASHINKSYDDTQTLQMTPNPGPESSGLKQKATKTKAQKSRKRTPRKQLQKNTRRKKAPVTDVIDVCNVSSSAATEKGYNPREGRYRTRSGRSINMDPNIYTIGIDDAEYSDSMAHVNLFSGNRKENVDLVTLDDSPPVENEELSVKVYWQGIDVYKFNIRRFQTIKLIYEDLSKRENVNMNQLLLTYNDVILKPDDTPDSINYNITKFIEGGIVYKNILTLSNLTDTKKSSAIKIKFQNSKFKKPIEIFIEKDERISIAMIKCAEQLDQRLENLRFEFDGDDITGSETPRDLDMEGDECIDFKIT